MSRTTNSPLSFPVNKRLPSISNDRITELQATVRLHRPVSVYHILRTLLVADDTMYFVLAKSAMTLFLWPRSIRKHFPVFILHTLLNKKQQCEIKTSADLDTQLIIIIVTQIHKHRMPLRMTRFRKMPYKEKESLVVILFFISRPTLVPRKQTTLIRRCSDVNNVVTTSERRWVLTG